MLSYIPIISAIIGSVLGAFMVRMLSRRKERLRTTLNLFRYYHSSEMSEARQNAWVYLNKDYPESPCAFSELFSDTAKGVHKGQYHALSQVLYFWYTIWMLHKENELARGLSRRMFAYQFGHWRKVLMPLYNKCLEENTEPPEWLPIMGERDMKWLINTT